MDVLVDVDMNQNQTEEFVLDNLAVAPATPVVGQQYFDTVLGFARTWNGVTWDAAVSAVGTFSTDIGDGLALSYVVAHNLGTLDVIVSLFNNTTGNEAVATVNHTSINTITVTFALPPILNDYRVTVIG